LVDGLKRAGIQPARLAFVFGVLATLTSTLTPTQAFAGFSDSLNLLIFGVIGTAWILLVF